MLYKVPPGFSIKINPLLGLNYGRFLFEAPPLEKTEFDYVREANSGDIIETCWGFCRNTEGIDDYFGIGIIDKDDIMLVQGYYTDVKIPLYEFVSWATRQDQEMPNHDWNLICYVGYYRPDENVLYATDWIEFTIKNISKVKPFPYWTILLLGIPLLLIPLVKKKANKN